MTTLTITLLAAGSTAWAFAVPHTTHPGDGDDIKKPAFSAPERLTAGGEVIATEAPGYAAPAIYDVNGDGRDDLVVGQFAGGKMKMYPRAEDGSFGSGEWIQAGGETAEVPGVW